MGEGGAVNIVKDMKLKVIVESLRDWGVIAGALPVATILAISGLAGNLVNFLKVMITNILTAIWGII